MRMIFGVLGLLFVVAIVGVLAKKQLGTATAPAAAVPAATGAVATPAGTPQLQVQQAQQAVQDAMQQARPMPDDVK
jgi:multidrug efflux pump subunit AcrB